MDTDFLFLPSDPAIRAGTNAIWGERLTTVWPRQGRHALAPKTLAAYPPADLTVERIEDLVNYDLPALLGANAGGRTALRV